MKNCDQVEDVVDTNLISLGLLHQYKNYPKRTDNSIENKEGEIMKDKNLMTLKQMDNYIERKGYPIDDITPCPTCFCMTHTIEGYCGKCKAKKSSEDSLVTGTPVKSVRKRGRPKKLPKPENLNYGLSENENKSERKED